MNTLGDAVNQVEARTFVGRDRELAVFREWLSRESTLPEILNISGHGGVGKSALLRAFARIAQEMGKPVIFADSRDFPHTPEGFIHALTDHSGVAAITYLNNTQPLILLDTFEELGDITRYLKDEFFPNLNCDMKVVIAGRYSLGRIWTEDSSWQKIIRSLPLGAFSRETSWNYLCNRGINETELANQLIVATGGNPLALSLAADMVQQLGIREFSSAPEWHLAVRSLVERLMREVNDPGLRGLLEACAVIRRFDEEILAAVSGQDQIGDAFARLSKLSAVRPTEHGLMLHDDLRRALAKDLRWRRPEYYRSLRLRALDYLRKRMHTAPPVEREWLMIERLVMGEDVFSQFLLLADAGEAPIWLEPGLPADHETIRRIWAYAAENTYGKDIEFEGAPERDVEFLEMVIQNPNTWLKIARDQDGNALGFCTVMPVCQETLPVLLHHPGYAALINAYWRPKGLSSLPVTAKESNIYYLLHEAHYDTMGDAVRSALLRNAMVFFRPGGIPSIATPLPSLKAVLENGFFEQIPGARTWTFGAKYPMDCFVLNLSSLGIDRWIEAIISGRKPLPWPDDDELERELQAVLTHWQNDAWVAQSILARILVSTINRSDNEVASELRKAVELTLDGIRSVNSPKEREVYNIVEATYFQPSSGPDQIARRFSVSRATYFRLLKRGIRGLAEALRKA